VVFLRTEPPLSPSCEPALPEYGLILSELAKLSSQMLRYDWSRPVLRLVWGAVMSAGLVIVRHTGGRYPIRPIHCDGDLFQGFVVFGAFFLGCCAIEGAIWGSWYRNHWREARSQSNNSEDYVLSGGTFVGIENFTGRILIASGCLGIGIAAGPNPCTIQLFGDLTWLLVIASLAASYGMLLFGDLIAK
jgi:hypothetical protein